MITEQQNASFAASNTTEAVAARREKAADAFFPLSNKVEELWRLTIAARLATYGLQHLHKIEVDPSEEDLDGLEKLMDEIVGLALDMRALCWEDWTDADKAAARMQEQM